MGWFKHKGGTDANASRTSPVEGTSPSSARKTRYVSPDIENVPSDLSKNKVPENVSPLRTRPQSHTSPILRALPPTSPTRTQSPYTAQTSPDQNVGSNKFFPDNAEEAPPPQDNVTATNSDDHMGSEDDEENMVITHPRNGGNELHNDISDAQRIDTADEDTGSSVAYETQRNTNQMNSLFNGHLMKWRYDSTEGPGFIRIPAFLGGLGLIGTTTAALVMYPETWTVSSIVISVFVYLIGITTCILDGRFFSSSPLSFRAHLRNIITRHFGIFRYLWGRGILYLAGGVLSGSLLITMSMISGAVMLLISTLALTVGSYSSQKFASLKHSLADDAFLLLEFSNHDSDDDGYIDPSEFANLLNSLGMELDDRYCLKAFNSMDHDHDRRISFEEFCHWWTQGYIERGRKVVDDEDSSYHRFT